ncbi:armadillo-type protein [Mycena floridula]|nr:armadillo-type protein [Mycena floridula]
MVDLSFLPTLSDQDIQHTAQLILQANPSQIASAEQLEQVNRLQGELEELQKKYEAWGLVVPLLGHENPYVQFFGAHTADIKIARDWDTFPQENTEALRDLLVQLTAHSMATGKMMSILRKLFSTCLSSLSLRLVPRHNAWPNWILYCVTTFSGAGAPNEHILEFLTVVVQNIDSANLTGASKGVMVSTLVDALGLVSQILEASMSNPQAKESLIDSGLKCLTAWLPHLPANNTTPLIPRIIGLLNPENETNFVSACDALLGFIKSSSFYDSAGSRSFTEPLLCWIDATGSQIVQASLKSGTVDEVSHALSELLRELGEHSISYLARNVTSLEPVQGCSKRRGELCQTYLRLMLIYTGFPGYFGIDEEVSERAHGFWYHFQEALWSEDDSDDGTMPLDLETRNTVTKGLYVEVVVALRRKVMYPPPAHGWSKDQVHKFQVYRRDLGDTLINAYYVLRDDMLNYLINDVLDRLAARQPGQQQGWEASLRREIEATLHCLAYIQEALDITQTPQMARIFNPDVIGRLPTSGHGRARRTTLNLIAAYASWFKAQPETADTTQQLNCAVGYTISALTDPTLCLQATNALRRLCDSNRKALAPQLNAFSELHAGIGNIPESEQSKVLESIASVVQALPPIEAIPAVEAMVNPVVQKMAQAFNSPNMLPAEAIALVIFHLETLTGIARGLTRAQFSSTGGMVELEDDFDLEWMKEIEAITRAREDPRTIRLREAIMAAVNRAMELYCSAIGVGQAVSDLFKAITSLPSDATLISLPPAPLLELVCRTIQQQVPGPWLPLARMLFGQLFPEPPFFPKDNPEVEAASQLQQKQLEEHAKTVVDAALPVLLSAVLPSLAAPNAMEDNPDLVREFFSVMDPVANRYVRAFYTLPPGALDLLLQCALRGLMLQERYSQIEATTFLSKLVEKSHADPNTVPFLRDQLLEPHGRPILTAVLSGIAGAVPRSVMPNLCELFGILLKRWVDQCKVWVREILFSNELSHSRASAEEKDRFIRGVLGSKSTKRITAAAQQFTLVSRGLEGSNFGYAAAQ